jgi:hypothetical protein
MEKAMELATMGVYPGATLSLGWEVTKNTTNISLMVQSLQELVERDR